jgi:hypothetical protein
MSNNTTVYFNMQCYNGLILLWSAVWIRGNCMFSNRFFLKRKVIMLLLWALGALMMRKLILHLKWLQTIFMLGKIQINLFQGNHYPILTFLLSSICIYLNSFYLVLSLLIIHMCIFLFNVVLQYFTSAKGKMLKM